MPRLSWRGGERDAPSGAGLAASVGGERRTRSRRTASSARSRTSGRAATGSRSGSAFAATGSRSPAGSSSSSCSSSRSSARRSPSAPRPRAERRQHPGGLDPSSQLPVGPWTTVTTEPYPGAPGEWTHTLRPRRRLAARPRHVPAPAVRGADLARGGDPGHVPVRLDRADHGPDRRLLPRHGGHGRLAPDGDRDGVPVSALRDRRRGDRRRGV